MRVLDSSPWIGSQFSTFKMEVLVLAIIGGYNPATTEQMDCGLP
jgi:hypothetical protein